MDRPDSYERFVIVRFTEEGFHHWPEAEAVLPERSYLASRHRHLFYVEVGLQVQHNDREVEFHDLLSTCRQWWPGPELGRSSCEDLARGYLDNLGDRFPGRPSWVSVFEDNEVGAKLLNLF